MSGRPTLADLVTDEEHAALDLLDDGPAAGPASHRQDPDLQAAAALARAAFSRATLTAARTALAAASSLAEDGAQRGPLEAAELSEAAAVLDRRPELAPAIAPAIELCAAILGVDRQSLAWATLVDLGQERSEAAGASPETAVLLRASAAMVERIAATRGGPSQTDRPAPGPDRPAPVVAGPRALEIFRSALVLDGGLGLRSQVLAADHPQHTKLATRLIQGEPGATAAQLVDAFAQATGALATIGGAQAEGPGAGSEPLASGSGDVPGDGPQRSFSWTHMVLAALVLGLTIWHYMFR